MGLSSGKQSKKQGAIKADVLGVGLFAVPNAYAADYDFFGPSALFPNEPEPSETDSSNIVRSTSRAPKNQR